MSDKSHILSIDSIYATLTKIIENEAKLPLDQMGPYIVGCTIAEEGIDSIIKDYPIIEDIGEIGASLEWQGEEYYDEYCRKLESLMAKLSTEINTK